MTNQFDSTTPQAQLVQILKKKGTGPTMSKRLSPDELAVLPMLFSDSSAHLTTKATLLTAFMTLPPTPEESEWIDVMKQGPDFIPTALHWIVGKPAETYFERLIQRIIAHEDLTVLRTKTVKINLPVVIDLSNAYDGYNRNWWLAPFVAAVLGAMGYPAVLHGIDEVSPKKGVNTYKLLELAGKSPIRSESQIIQDLMTSGWTYVDQSVYSPALFGLKSLRVNMVKRPVLATVEKMVLPVRGEKTYLITGYTHPPYKTKTLTLMARLPLAGGVVVRGIEGSTQLALDRRTPEIKKGQGAIEWVDGFIAPEDVGLTRSPERTEPDYDLCAFDSLSVGVGALQGESGAAQEMIVYQSAAILYALGLDRDVTTLAARVRDAISSGKALTGWQRVG
ncbi:hypothetical protein EBR96_06520 [bacterium]|nr:hypothetical protein [bacterium]